MSILARFTCIAQVLAATYVAVAVVNISQLHVVRPFLAWARNPGSSTYNIAHWATPDLLQHPWFSPMWPSGVQSATEGALDATIPLRFAGNITNAAMMNLSELMSDSLLTQEEQALSKAFSQAMQPSRVIPFYYRRTGIFEDNDITITTLVTMNRFAVFTRLVETYQGPISVTIYVPDNSTSMQELLTSLHTLYTSSYSFSHRVDVHLVISPFDRQFNAWRNVARLFARTTYVMMLDVDFSICTDWRRSIMDLLGEDDDRRTIRKEGEELARLLKDGRAALVVPAFEYIHAKEGSDASSFPHDKQSLLALVKAGSIGMFHRSWAPGHNSTDYDRYFSIPPDSGEVYKVMGYQSAYEPYVILRKDAAPWCDERFVGYGANKAACLFEMYLSGVSFYVMADHFLIHQRHPYEEAARKLERKHNKKIYADFKEEMCLRYLSRFLEEGDLRNPRGSNALYECHKYRGIAKLVSQMLKEAGDMSP